MMVKILAFAQRHDPSMLESVLDIAAAMLNDLPPLSMAGPEAGFGPDVVWRLYSCWPVCPRPFVHADDTHSRTRGFSLVRLVCA